MPGAGRRVLPRADILVEDGRIAAVGPRLGVGRADRVIDARERIVVPGFVNAHCHTYETFNRGRIVNRPTEVWALYGHPVLGQAPRTPEEVYYRTLLPCVEMLKAGITTVVDDVSLFGDYRDEIVDAIMQAYRDSGIRGVMAVRVMDLRFDQNFPLDLETVPADLRRQLAAARPPGVRQLMAWSRRTSRRQDRLGGRVRFAVTPSAPQRCSDELLRASHRLARERGFPYTIHVQETRLQAVHGPRKYGRSMLAHLARLGVLSEITSISHGIWLDDADIGLVAKAGATVVHNPTSNLRVGSGLAPVRRLLEAGVNVALGCDGMSSNDAQNLFEQMKLAASMHSLSDPDYRRWITPHESLAMATAGGAHSALLGRAVGSIERGRRADLVLLDRATPAFTPLNDVVTQIVHAENGRGVRTVLVDGQVVVDDGRVVTVDERRVYDAVNLITERLRAEQRRVTRIAKRLEPAWRRMVFEHQRAPLPVQRHAWPSYR